MVSDYDCALLCQAVYDGGHTEVGYNLPAIDFEHFDPGTDDGICWGLSRFGAPYNTDVVVFRGSKTFQDWIRDLLALALPFSHDKLGPVHPGFLLGLSHVWEELRPLLQYPVIVTGHSLGAGRASILAGLMKADSYPPVRRVCFGEPKPGFALLRDFLTSVPSVSYRNRGMGGHDLVTDVPFSFPPEEYLHPSPLVDVSVEPMRRDWGPFSYHHMELYLKALEGDK